MARSPDIYQRLASSIAPSISGDYTVDIKKALACQLLGGSRKVGVREPEPRINGTHRLTRRLPRLACRPYPTACGCVAISTFCCWATPPPPRVSCSSSSKRCVCARSEGVFLVV
jgi:hypothetical protein